MEKLAFEIGFDHYRFDLPLDIARFANQHRQQINYGFDAAKHQQVTQKKPDLYERKLMTLRDRALIKGLEVTVTVKDLQEYLLLTKGCCPVTKQPFTFAENNDTDWSIDRVDNSRGYYPDNIVVVSVVVNQAKSDLDLAGIIKQFFCTTRSSNLLSEIEWFRLVCFYYHKMKLLKPLSMCKLLSDSQLIFDQVVFMQLFKKNAKMAKPFLQTLEKYSSKDSIKKASKLTQKRVYHRSGIELEVLYDSPKLYQSVQKFINIINAHSKEFDPILMDCMFA
jgi:hypothetical protein